MRMNVFIRASQSESAFSVNYYAPFLKKSKRKRQCPRPNVIECIFHFPCPQGQNENPCLLIISTHIDSFILMRLGSFSMPDPNSSAVLSVFSRRSNCALGPQKDNLWHDLSSLTLAFGIMEMFDFGARHTRYKCILQIETTPLCLERVIITDEIGNVRPLQAANASLFSNGTRWQSVGKNFPPGHSAAEYWWSFLFRGQQTLPKRNRQESHYYLWQRRISPSKVVKECLIHIMNFNWSIFLQFAEI